jgi:hypothetical protein
MLNQMKRSLNTTNLKIIISKMRDTSVEETTKMEVRTIFQRIENIIPSFPSCMNLGE